MDAAHRRLEEARENKAAWRKWGPYLSERQWGTVREDSSEGGNAWDYFTHDQARSRAYRWGEDGLAGISDDRQRLCFALALWNGKDAENPDGARVRGGARWIAADPSPQHPVAHRWGGLGHFPWRPAWRWNQRGLRWRHGGRWSRRSRQGRRRGSRTSLLT